MKNWPKLQSAIFPVIFVLLGASIAFVSKSYGIGTIGNPRGGFFPLFIGLVLIITGILDLRSELKASHKEEVVEGASILSGLLLAVVLLLWPLLLHSLGFLVVTFIGTAVLCKVLGGEGWLRPTILAIGVTVGCYYLFKKWFYLDLPDGALVEWLKAMLGG